MRSTGIIRRIDDLGRVPIPKEIRRIMHLHDGDPVEFFLSTDKKTLSMCRYQPLGEVIKEEAKHLLSAFKEAFGVTIIVVDDIGCVVESTEQAFIGKRLNTVPTDDSSIVKLNEDEIYISGNSRIITNRGNSSEHYEGMVLVVGEHSSETYIAQAIAYAISRKVEEVF